MSLKASSWAIHSREETPINRLVLISLAYFANEDGVVYAGREFVKRVSGLSGVSARKAMMGLEKKGLIEECPQWGRDHVRLCLNDSPGTEHHK